MFSTTFLDLTLKGTAYVVLHIAKGRRAL